MAASTPVRWSVAEVVDATAALETVAVSLAKSEAEEDDAWGSIEYTLESS